MRHVHGVQKKSKHIPSGWQGTLRRAQGAGKGIRTCTDLYGRLALGAVRAMFPGISKAHSCGGCRLAGHIAQSRYWGQRMSDRSDLSDLSDDWHLVQSVPCAPEIQKRRAQQLGRTSLCIL